MKSTLLSNTVKAGKKLGLTILGFAAITLSAQMTGSYTINASNAASTTNFKDWRSLSQGLQGLSRNDLGPTLAGGVSGAVTVDVQSSITEGGQVVFPQITGMSSTNTVKINGNAYALTFAGPYEAISFTGGDYFSISNLTINNGSSTNAIGIRFSNASDYNTIDKCTIQFSAITSGTTSGTNAYIAFAASSTALTTASTVSNGSYNTISGCTMRTTNTNSPGPGYGISMMGNTSNYTSTASNNTVTGNTIENFYYMGIINFYTNGNQIISNDVSRKNATTYNCFSTMIGLYNSYTYSSNRSTLVSKNNFHDIPFVGATSSSAPTTIYGSYAFYNYGNSTNRFIMDGNTWSNWKGSGSLYTNYNYYNQFYDFTNNLIEKCEVPISSSSAYYFYGSMHYGSFNYRLNGNTLQNCKGGYYLYGLRNEWANTSSTQNEMNNNVIQNNSNGYYYTYLLRVYYAQNNAAYPVNIIGNTISGNTCDYYYLYALDIEYYSNVNIQRNTVANNRNASTLGYVYAVYNYYNYDSKVNNNLIYGNAGYYGTYGIYSYYGSTNSYSHECRQNTVSINGSNSGYAYHYAYPIMNLMYYHPKNIVEGNILHAPNNYGCMFYAYSYYTPNPWSWDYNSYWFPNVSYLYFYTLSSGSATTFSGWQSLGLCGKNEYYGDPKFVSSTNYRSTIFENQNNVPTTASSPFDHSGAARNPTKSDRGALESYLDIQAVSTNFSVPASVCAGYEVSGGTNITVKNLFPTDTAYGFNVSYSVNGGAKTSEVVSTKLLTNGQTTVTFSKGLKLNQVGNNRIAIFIDMPDDNRTNDSFIFNTTVKPAPGGSRWNFSATPSQTVYQTGKNDVTVVNEKAIYDINPPRAYGNTDYGVKWTATAYATSASGAAVTGASISKNPTGSNDMEYTFTTSNVNLEDSMITMYLKLSDLTNGCDTIIKRNILVYPTIKPDFTFPTKICNGDDVEFNNTSTVRSGNMEFEWDFGTGNPADNSTAPNPIFQFPGTGNYTVKMTARTLPYGFTVTKTQTVNVSPIPTTAFSKVNACEGQNLTFTNKTVPANSTYTWAFGDGSFSTATNPTKMYATTGQYIVTLKANLNGCIGEISQRVYQFDKPKANFTLVSGTCDNDKFVFDNKSAIKDGLFGNMWDFNDGNVSTEDEPVHAFASFGKKQVKLTTTSEFGCVDSKTVEVTVNESPKTDFTHDPACSLTPTTFTNTTPAASSIVKSYNWNFGDGGTATAESPVHSWTALGPKTVTYTIELLNGCKATATKDLSVGVQPNVVFSAENVCAGDPVVFENNTSWAQGDITFNWNFGDNTSSTNSDPQHVYTTNVTKTYNVTLKASIAGGCEATLTKPVTVNQGPTTCDFANTADYGFGFYGMKFDPMDAGGNQKTEAGVTYTWVFDGGGTQKGGTTSYNFQEDGSYTVTMRARVDATGCECTVTKTVVMNRTNAKDLEATGMTVFPNPSNGAFNVAITGDYGKDVLVEVLSMNGSLIQSEAFVNNGLIQMNAANLAAGSYVVRVKGSDKTGTEILHIQN